jgi:beta-galactosidase
VTRVRRENRRLAELLPLRRQSAAILVEYPYYRSDPAHWAANLRQLRELGADVITAYVPWRLHEIDLGGGVYDYDFTGRSQPHADLTGFLGLVEDAGLLAVLKPGPYIYAEVRLGGLPDRIVHGESKSAMTASGQHPTSEAQPLPSAFDPSFRSASRAWLSALREQVLHPLTHPSGPISAIQLGNEGIYGELNKPMTASDFSTPALDEWRHWAGEEAIEVDGGGTFPKKASPQARTAWARWSGTGLSVLLDEFRSALGNSLVATVNLPLPELSGCEAEPEAWFSRAVRVVPAGVLPGHTSWAGNAAQSDTALSAVWFGMRLLRADTVEDNWGFTWTDETYAVPIVPVYHGILGLACGSSTIAVYTGCTTWSWPRIITPDQAGLVEDGEDPERYAAPYCPGAPVDESGATHANARGLQLLRRFLDWHGTALLGTAFKADAWLVVDQLTVAEQAWSPGQANSTRPLPVAVAGCTRWMVQDGRQPDVALPDDQCLAVPPVAGRSWVVVGGRSMCRSLQARLTEGALHGERVFVVGLLPSQDETGAPCRTLASAFTDLSDANLGLVHLRDTADAPAALDPVAVLHALLRGAEPAHAAVTPPLRLIRADEVTNTAFVFLLSRSDAENVANGTLGRVDYSVSMPPRGAVVLVLRDDELAGFLVAAVNEAAGVTGTLDLTVGVERIALGRAGDAVGRRTTEGWEINVLAAPNSARREG